MVEGSGRADKHTQSQEEWWRGEGGQTNTLRAGRSGVVDQEGSQAFIAAGAPSKEILLHHELKVPLRNNQAMWVASTIC